MRNSSNHRTSGYTQNGFNPVYKIDTLNEDSTTDDQRKVKTAVPHKRRRNLKLCGKSFN